MTVARMVLGTIIGIPRALALADADLDDLYDVAQALHDARNAVLNQALDVVALSEGHRIVAEHRRASPSHQEGRPAE